MPQPKLSDEKAQEALDAFERIGNKNKAANHLGLNRDTFRYRLEQAEKRQLSPRDLPFEAAEVPDDDLPIPELIAYRKRQFERKQAHRQAVKLRDIRVKLDGPIAICHFGDPHVDDDGTDLALLESHIAICKKTEGMFAANLGDLQNNWIGRLTRLWASQGTSARQAWQLVEWMVHSVDWLYIVGGNHDAWSGTGDPLQWIMAQTGTVFAYHGVRLNIVFPNRKQVRVNARHDFTGNSMWNEVHGAVKAVKMGWRDHILTCGHKHTSMMHGPMKDPSGGTLSWAIRCAGYKIFDSYAEEKGLPDQNAFPACVTIIDPQYGDDDTRLITVIPDVQEGAEFLKYKRQKWSRNQTETVQGRRAANGTPRTQKK